MLAGANSTCPMPGSLLRPCCRVPLFSGSLPLQQRAHPGQAQRALLWPCGPEAVHRLLPQFRCPPVQAAASASTSASSEAVPVPVAQKVDVPVAVPVVQKTVVVATPAPTTTSVPVVIITKKGGNMDLLLWFWSAIAGFWVPLLLYALFWPVCCFASRGAEMWCPCAWAAARLRSHARRVCCLLHAVACGAVNWRLAGCLAMTLECLVQ